MYDYVGGLEDWASAGEELAGEQGGGRPLVASLAADVPTVPLDATLGDVRAVIGDAPFALVVNEARIVLGKVLARSLEPDDVDDAPVDSRLIEGPTTVRAATALPDLVERMESARTSSVIVTSNQGELVGVLFTADARRALDDLQAAHEHHHH